MDDPEILFSAHCVRCQCAVFLSRLQLCGWMMWLPRVWTLIKSGCDLKVGLNLIVGEIECSTVSSGYGFYKQGTETIIYSQRRYSSLHSIRVIINLPRALLDVSDFFLRPWIRGIHEYHPALACMWTHLSRGPPKSSLYTYVVLWVLHVRI